MSIVDEIAELDRLWVRAELAQDREAMAALTTEDFTLVGPFGFVLDRDQWLARYTPEGGLDTTELSYHDATTRQHGDTAVTIGVHRQRATYAGNDATGDFRATHVAVRENGRWLLAGMHLSPMPPAGGPPRR